MRHRFFLLIVTLCACGALMASWLMSWVQEDPSSMSSSQAWVADNVTGDCQAFANSTMYVGRGKRVVWDCWLECLSELPRPWLVLVGDSNWRHIFQLLDHHFRLINGITAVWSSSGMQERIHKDHRDERWYDRDVVYTTASLRSVRLSFRFMWSESVILKHWDEHGAGFWNEIRACGELAEDVPKLAKGQYVCETPSQTDDFNASRWPDVPYAAIMTHGLWGLPRKSKGHKYGDCRARRKSGEMLLRLTRGVCFLRWASNFVKISHPTITNADVQADMKCQGTMAAELGLPLLNVSSYTGVKGAVTDFHFTEGVQRRIVEDFMAGLCPACSATVKLSGMLMAAAAAAAAAALVHA